MNSYSVLRHLQKSPPDNGLGQYVSSPGNRAYCYAELAVHRQYSFCLPVEGWPG